MYNGLMESFTPHTKLLMELLKELADPSGSGSTVFYNESQFLSFLPGALKLINGDVDAPAYPKSVQARLRRERDILERASFIGSTELILFDAIYGNQIKKLHRAISSPRLTALQLNLKVILDKHLYSGGGCRKELIAELNRTSDYLYSSRAKNEVEIRVFEYRHLNKKDWPENYTEVLAVWQSLVDELFLYWELES